MNSLDEAIDHVISINGKRGFWTITSDKSLGEAHAIGCSEEKCPFAMVISKNTDGKWEYTILDYEHNHPSPSVRENNKFIAIERVNQTCSDNGYHANTMTHLRTIEGKHYTIVHCSEYFIAENGKLSSMNCPFEVELVCHPDGYWYCKSENMTHNHPALSKEQYMLKENKDNNLEWNETQFDETLVFNNHLEAVRYIRQTSDRNRFKTTLVTSLVSTGICKVRCEEDGKCSFGICVVPTGNDSSKFKVSIKCNDHTCG